ncbi:MAG: glutamate--tRNA ligase [Candidatus Pacebacteria bacterium]|nr:glutamate--tRNA ligase [Candidatus Paceibacterota bacterium]
MAEDFKLSTQNEIRVRYAPSPTGFLHIGGSRVALFNYLFAKQNNGKYILRIEDTDIERSKSEYDKDILESLKWLGIHHDEGPDVGGNFGPYRQRERLDIYEKYIKKLLADGNAYYCFCTEEDLEAQRQYQLSRGEAPKYSGKCKNLSKEEVEENLINKKPCVIRFKVNPKKVDFKDIIKGDLEFDMSLSGDIVIAKNLRYPLFILAGVIDDYEMKISHVIRGDDHIPNTPKQILIQEALEFPKVQYAHLPMILGQDRSKLSKRHGATAVSEYKKQGYLPEALVNFMVFLGWNPGTEREIYSMNSLIKEFSLEKVQKAGAIFNTKRLDFLNGFYIRERSLEKITELSIPYFIDANFIQPIFKTEQYPPAYGAKEILLRYKAIETGEEITLETLQKIISIYKERLKKLSEISELTDFFFKEKLDYDKNLLKWKEMSDSEIKISLENLEKIISEIPQEEWSRENLETKILPEAERAGDRGKTLWPLRAALTGKQASAGPFEVAEILGKEKVLKRLKEASEKF